MFKDTKAFSGFSVDNLDKAKAFYGELLGIDVKQQREGLVLNISGGGKIFVYPKPNHEPATFTILNFSVPSVDEAVDQLTAKGVEFLHYNEEDYKTDEKGVNRS